MVRNICKFCGEGFNSQKAKKYCGDICLENSGIAARRSYNQAIAREKAEFSIETPLIFLPKSARGFSRKKLSTVS